MLRRISILCIVMVICSSHSLANEDAELPRGASFTPKHQRFPMLTHQEFMRLDPESQREYVLIVQDFMVDLSKITPNGMPQFAHSKWERWLQVFGIDEISQAQAEGPSQCQLQYIGTARDVRLLCPGKNGQSDTISVTVPGRWSAEETAQALVREMNQNGYTGPKVNMNAQQLGAQVQKFVDEDSGSMTFAAMIKRPAERVTKTVSLPGRALPVVVEQSTVGGKPAASEPFQVVKKFEGDRVVDVKTNVVQKKPGAKILTPQEEAKAANDGGLPTVKGQKTGRLDKPLMIPDRMAKAGVKPVEKVSKTTGDTVDLDQVAVPEIKNEKPKLLVTAKAEPMTTGAFTKGATASGATVAANGNCQLATVGTSSQVRMRCPGKNGLSDTITLYAPGGQTPEQTADNLMKQMNDPSYKGPKVGLSKESLTSAVKKYQDDDKGSSEFLAPIRYPENRVTKTVSLPGQSEPVVIEQGKVNGKDVIPVDKDGKPIKPDDTEPLQVVKQYKSDKVIAAETNMRQKFKGKDENIESAKTDLKSDMAIAADANIQKAKTDKENDAPVVDIDNPEKALEVSEQDQAQETPQVSDISAKPIKRELSARQKENRSMKQLEKREKNFKKPIKCIFAGFAIKNEDEEDSEETEEAAEGKEKKCEPKSEFVNEKTHKVYACNNEGISNETSVQGYEAVLPKKKLKGKTALCNPLVFGLDKDGAAFCVPRDKKATESCRYVSSKSSQKETALKSSIDLARDNPGAIEEIRWTYERLCQGNEADLKTILEKHSEAEFEKSKADLAQTCTAYEQKLAQYQGSARLPANSKGKK